MTTGRQNWQAWHRDYDDADSPVSRRLVQVRARLAMLLREAAEPVRLLNLCCGDGRDTVPVLAGSDREVDACLVELDPGLAEGARRAAAEAGVRVEVRAGDAAAPTTYADRLPVDVLMLVGVLGNVSDADAERTIGATASMVVPGGTVVWSRSNRFRAEPTHGYADPAEWARARFEAHGFETREFLVPEVDAWRLGISVLRRPGEASLPETLFRFVR
jgi:2-polyprenyl-3-methyl-5-hydroxy-6-metoxy-1,4-benzoquinol methylase